MSCPVFVCGIDKCVEVERQIVMSCVRLCIHVCNRELVVESREWHVQTRKGEGVGVGERERERERGGP